MQQEMKTTQEQEADQMASGTAKRTNNNSFRSEIFSPLPLQPCLYLDDLDIVASDHELRVVCHEVAGVPRLGGVVLPVPPVMIYPVSALLL